MNFPARLIAAVMVVILALTAFQSGPFQSGPTAPRPAEAQGTASTAILTSVLSTMGKGALSEASIA
jgi:hypothetical protein